jgi:hypothetical protein
MTDELIFREFQWNRQDLLEYKPKEDDDDHEYLLGWKSEDTIKLYGDIYKEYDDDDEGDAAVFVEKYNTFVYVIANQREWSYLIYKVNDEIDS